MAVLRSITALEEAATAIFHSVKRIRYTNADRLQRKDHVHKLGLLAFLQAMSPIFAPMRDRFHPQYFIDRTGRRPRLHVRGVVGKQADGTPIVGTPDDPLNFTIKELGATELHRFTSEVRKLASDRNAKSVLDMFRVQANRRNQVLYASCGGIPWVTGPLTEYLKYTQGQVMWLLRIYLLVDQTSRKQLFVQQALDAFVDILAKTPAKSLVV